MNNINLQKYKNDLSKGLKILKSIKLLSDVPRWKNKKKEHNTLKEYGMNEKCKGERYFWRKLKQTSKKKRWNKIFNKS